MMTQPERSDERDAALDALQQEAVAVGTGQVTAQLQEGGDGRQQVGGLDRPDDRVAAVAHEPLPPGAPPGPVT